MKGQLIASRKHVKPPGVNINNSLEFETHVKELCKKVKQEVHLED